MDFVGIVKYLNCIVYEIKSDINISQFRGEIITFPTVYLSEQIDANNDFSLVRK